MTWSINAAAAELDIDRRTLTKRLKDAGLKAGRGAKFSTKQIFEALRANEDPSEEKRIKLWMMREKAEAQALENEKERGRLVEVDEVYKWAEAIFSPAWRPEAAEPRRLACGPSPR